MGFEMAVFGRPVHFIDDDPMADRRAQDTLEAIARQVGFREVSFQFEPIGAALHYECTLSREELVLIADIGGGTADFSIVRLSPERMRHDDRRADVLGNAGIHIGGTYFDRVLSLECVMPQLGLSIDFDITTPFAAAASNCSHVSRPCAQSSRSRYGPTPFES